MCSFTDPAFFWRRCNCPPCGSVLQCNIELLQRLRLHFPSHRLSGVFFFFFQILRLCFVITKTTNCNLLQSFVTCPSAGRLSLLSPTGGGAPGGGGGRGSAGVLDTLQAAVAQPDRVSVQAAQKGDSIARRYQTRMIHGGQVRVTPPASVWAQRV